MATPTATTPTTTQATPTDNPMAVHVKVVAILNLVLGGLLALMAIVMLFGLGVGTAAVMDAQQYGAPGWVADMMATLAVIFTVLFGGAALVSTVAAIQLLAGKRSAKGWGMAASVIHVLFGLIGTFTMMVGIIGLAAGIYGIVILLNQQTDQVLVH